MLQGTLNGAYRNKSGNRMYTYIVSGTPSDIAAYKLAKGEYNVETDKGEPLFFLPAKDAEGADRIIEPTIKLIITTNGRVVIDDIAAEQRLMKDTQSHVAVEWAKAIAAKKMGFGTTTRVPAPPVKVDPLTNPADLIPSTTEGLVPEGTAEGTETIGG